MRDFENPLCVRDEIWQHIDKRVQSLEKGYRQNVGIVGPPGLGKTRFLSFLYQELSRRPAVIPVYVDACAGDYESFVERWICAVLSGLFSGQAHEPPSNVSSLLKAAEPIVPLTTERIRQLKKMVRGEKGAASLRELFSLTRILSEETRKTIVLMIDEFEKMESLLPATDPFSLLGKEIMVEKNTFYLVTSSLPARATEILREKFSLLFGNFEVIPFHPLGFEECMGYLRGLLPNQGLTPSVADYVIRMTDGHPRYLELIAEGLRSLGRDLEPADIVDAFCHELYDGRGRLYWIFLRRADACRNLTKENTLCLKALFAICHGRRKLLAIASFMGRKVKEAKKILQRLLREELILKRGSFYMVEDCLFRFWLREVYQKREQQHLPEGEGLRRGLVEALRREFEKSELLIHSDISAHVEALFKEFRNDVVEIDRRRIRCPQFSEIGFRPSNGRVFPLLARSPEVRWLCQIAREPVGEEDIAFFLEELKRYRKGVQRRIMITLAGIDQNAKLMAQAAHIQLWDLRSFNALLDLYDRPKMILAPTRA